MTYTEHEQLLYEQRQHKKEINEAMDYLMQMEEIMEKLIKERDDIVVIERHQMMVEKNWKLRHSNLHGVYAHSYEDRYVNFPRFLTGDELAKSLDEGFMEMHGEIRKLQEERNLMEAGRKKDKDDFNKLNKAIPINVWNVLSDRQRERVRKMCHKAHQKLAKK